MNAFMAHGLLGGAGGGGGLVGKLGLLILVEYS
jgi:hypothetical protein